MEIREDLYYAKTHEWVQVDGDTVTIGISDFAVEELNKEIVNVELPHVDDVFKQNESFGVLDAVKAAFDLYAPISGVVTEVNEALLDDPTQVALGPYTNGWMIKLKADNIDDLSSLMKADAYRNHLESENNE